jgi:hypothetical protein
MRLARKNKTKRKGFIDARSDDDTEANQPIKACAPSTR